MKKILTTLAILIVAATASFAQIGARIGMDFASLNGDYKNKNFYDMKSGIGLHLGLVYNHELADALSIQPGVFLVQRNWKYEDIDDETGKKFDAKVHSNWIEIPVVLKYNVDITSDISIDPHVGPYFGFGFAGKDKETKTKVFKKYKDGDEKSGMGMPNFDMGVQFGCGATFFGTAYVGFDYELGFRNTLNKYPGHLSSHNGMFMITFGVFIPE